MLVAWWALVLVARPLPFCRHRDPPQRAHSGRDEPDPLAEPLARGAPELAVLPERLRRADRQPRDADGEALRESAMASIRAVWYIASTA